MAYATTSPRRHAPPPKMIKSTFTLTLLLGLFLCGISGCGENSPPAVTEPADSPRQDAAFVRRHEWIDAKAAWFKVDTHVHSDFSDGGQTVESLVEAAVNHGCDAIAITDHGDRDRDGASEQYFTAIHRTRKMFPGITVLAGLEWNIPPHGGNEHVTILLEPTADEAVILAEFKDRFDDLYREPSSPELALEGLKWLTDKCRSTDTLAVVFYNHPSRKRYELTSFLDEFPSLRLASPLLVGFEGAPGHQAGDCLGAYEGPIELSDRWDPLAARVGGAWDQLLGRGVDAWAALATSDFHAHQASGGHDYYPGEFSETWVYARDRSARGLLQALEAGSFFGVHGQIARQVALTASAGGLPRAANAGETIRLAQGAACRIAMRAEIPDQDWSGAPNAIDVVEFIGITADDARVIGSVSDMPSDKEMSIDVKIPSGGIVIRARGRREIPDRPDLLFMTNPIRIIAD